MLQVSLLLVSFVGYFLLLYILFKGRKTAFYPAILASGIITGSFLAGLLNILGQVFGFIYITGFVLIPLCIMYIVRHRNRFNRPKVHVLVPFVVFAAGAVVLYLMLKDRFLYAYDDFSHWAKVVRAITENLRLPIEADQLTHGSYPPGSALFISYVSTIVGAADDHWLLAQGLLTLSFWLPMIGCSRKPIIQVVLVVLLAAMMQHTSLLVSMYVDLMLAAVAFTGIMFVLNGDENRSVWLLVIALFLCVLVLIKNSGTFLALMIAVYAGCLWKKRMGKLSVQLLWMTVPFLVLLVWHVYYRMNFLGTTGHQMSVANYQRILGGKTAEDIRWILKLILSRIINPWENHALVLIPGYLLTMLLIKRQGTLHEVKHVYVAAALMLFLYEAGMLAMYLFSMPMSEIVSIQGTDYVRYNGTITALLIGIQIHLICHIDVPKLRKECIGAEVIRTAALLLLVCQVSYVLSLGYQKNKDINYRKEKSTTAYAFSLIKDRLKDIPHGASFIVLLAETEDEGYDRYITRYYFYSLDIERCYDRDEALALRVSEPWKYYVDLCSGIIEPPTETVNIELFPRTNEKDCTNVLTSIGYKQNTRYSTTNDDDIISYHWDISGYIPIKAGDVIRLKNVEWYPSDENDGRGALYWYFTSMKYRSKQSVNTAEDIAKWNPVYDEYGSIVQITVPDDIGTTTGYLRIGCQGINSTSVITVNEEIR